MESSDESENEKEEKSVPRKRRISNFSSQRSVLDSPTNISVRTSVQGPPKNQSLRSSLFKREVLRNPETQDENPPVLQKPHNESTGRNLNLPIDITVDSRPTNFIKKGQKLRRKNSENN